jgi:hypothetical protein
MKYAGGMNSRMKYAGSMRMTLPPVPRHDAGFWKAHWRVGEALARMEPRVALALGGAVIPHRPVFLYGESGLKHTGARAWD